MPAHPFCLTPIRIKRGPESDSRRSRKRSTAVGVRERAAFFARKVRPVVGLEVAAGVEVGEEVEVAVASGAMAFGAADSASLPFAAC